jgi:sugar phosphate permease
VRFRLAVSARQPAVAGALAALLLGANLAAPLYAVYRERFGFNSLVLTLVFAVYALALAPSLLLFGELSDRIGRRPVILGGLVLGTVALGLFALASSVAWLFAARVVQGVSVGMAGGAATAALVELDPKADGRHAALLATLAQTLGGGAAPLVTGVLAEWAPAPRVLCYLVGMLACVICAALVLAMPEPGSPRGGGWSVPRPSVPADIRIPFARVAVTGAAVWAVVALFFSVVPSYASERLSTGNLALLGAISALVLVCSSVAQVASRDAVAPRLAQAVGLCVLTAGLAMLVLASVSDRVVVLLAASALAGTGHGLAFLGAQDDLNGLAPGDRRGEINAAFYTCIYLGIAVPVIGVGVLADLTSLVTAVNVFAVVIGSVATAVAIWHIRAGGLESRVTDHEKEALDG